MDATKRSGMTLVELLIVLVIVGILASVFTLRMREATASAKLAAVQADLRTFAVAKHVHEVHTGTLGGTLEEIGFHASPGVQLTMTWSAPEGYAATAFHTAVPAVECGVFTGPAPGGVAGPAQVAGVVACQ